MAPQVLTTRLGPIPLQIKSGAGRESLLELFKITGFMRLVEQASLTKKKNSKPLINTRMGLAPDKQVGVKPGHVPSLSVKTLESVKK